MTRFFPASACGPISRQLSRSLCALLAGAASAAVVAAAGVASAAPPATSSQASADQGDMSGMEGRGGHHRARARARLQHMLSQVNATPEQRAKIEAIMNKAFDQIAPLHKKMEEGHSELHRLLGQSTIDRNALERIRAARISDLDQASKIMVKALADSAEVLKPEQRAKLAQLEEARRQARREHRGR